MENMPFYMTYPMQNLYLMEMEYEKDLERIKECYPREVEELQKKVEEFCDKLEFEGSRIYDENPDRAMMQEEATRLYEEISNTKAMPLEKGYFDMVPFSFAKPEPSCDSWLCALVGIMFDHEVYRRRCRHRRCQRWW